MARGDSIGDKIAVVADDADQDIKPASGDEWTVDNIGWSGAGTDTPIVNIYKEDGTGAVLLVDSRSAPQLNFNVGYISGWWKLTENDWINVKNVSGANIAIWWTGTKTKE